MPKYNLYVIDIDYRRNCHSCQNSGHITRNYKNKRIIKKERRMEYVDNINKKCKIYSITT